MKKHLPLGIALLFAGTSMAVAQTDVPGYPGVKVVPVATATTPAAAESIRKQLSDKLTAAGYSDVKITPEAFVVAAKNKAGEPVVMFLSPDSMTMFTAVDAKGQDTATAPPAAAPKP